MLDMEQCVTFEFHVQCGNLLIHCLHIFLHYLFLTFVFDVYIVFIQGPYKPKTWQKLHS